MGPPLPKERSLAEDDPEDCEVAADGAADHEAEDDGPGDVGRPRHVVQRLVAAAAVLVKLSVCGGCSSMGPPQKGKLTWHQTFFMPTSTCSKGRQILAHP